ncbi:hypothetical protein ACFL27_17770 [candidate division CSSED10-310 bacterium]|uniref:Uncharacterized protein n=1 Tax=candidate division CSSED10-310 bacterium TaxID=2855610 RepID=A0ABV6Z0S1_UNCC1
MSELIDNSRQRKDLLKHVILQHLAQLQDEQLYELITPFVPAPLIDVAKTKNFQAWSPQETSDLVKTYFKKK